ncbi:MAG TPA: hypothetical protein VMV19_00630 [Xanthobacteraceae bacterium]|nr:hypothetical protein [Xanthobacteraceae bacterium]
MREAEQLDECDVRVDMTFKGKWDSANLYGVIIARGFCALIVLLLFCTLSLAKGGSYHTEDRYKPQHIDSLPPEIRNTIMRRCNTPRALHDFAKYSENSHRIVLRFEYFYCDQKASFCKPSGCLHEVYSSSGGRYRLLRSYYAPK